jgi:nitrous oxidase accessory protein NosD
LGWSNKKINFIFKFYFQSEGVKLRKLLILSITLTLLISTASAATLDVGPQATYHTIQSAIDAAHDGDTINVASGIYNETIQITNKQLSIIGQNYPSIKGARLWGGVTGMLYGLAFTESGVALSDGGHITIRNCRFTNCGIDIWTQTSTDCMIINNYILNGGILLYETYNNSVIGNYISGAEIGLQMGGGATCKSITKNTFEKCQVAAQLETIPTGMTGNAYKNNKINIKLVPPV